MHAVRLRLKAVEDTIERIRKHGSKSKEQKAEENYDFDKMVLAVDKMRQKVAKNTAEVNFLRNHIQIKEC